MNATTMIAAPMIYHMAVDDLTGSGSSWAAVVVLGLGSTDARVPGASEVGATVVVAVGSIVSTGMMVVVSTGSVTTGVDVEVETGATL